MNRLFAALIVSLVGLLGLSGCANQPSDLFVVLPHEDGSVGGIEIDYGTDKVVLDQPNTAVRTGEPENQSFEMKQDEVETIFSAALASQPIPPKSFTLYFESGTTKLIENSKPEFQNIFADIEKREVAEVMVIGHTDRVGKLLTNDELALKRAEVIMELFVEKGIDPNALGVAGRGEREPLVQTADGVAEAKNRRVEISVR